MVVGILPPQYIVVTHEPVEVIALTDGKQKQAPSLLQHLDPPPNWVVREVGGPPQEVSLREEGPNLLGGLLNLPQTDSLPLSTHL